MSHLKNNYIFGILESRPTIWHTFKQISSTFNFWPPYNPMGSFWSPVFQNAQWCQSGISLFACQDMSKSQKQQKYCNYTRLPSPKFILLFVNSTTQFANKVNCLYTVDLRRLLHYINLSNVDNSMQHHFCLQNQSRYWMVNTCCTGWGYMQEYINWPFVLSNAGKTHF